MRRRQPPSTRTQPNTTRITAASDDPGILSYLHPAVVAAQAVAIPYGRSVEGQAPQGSVSYPQAGRLDDEACHGLPVGKAEGADVVPVQQHSRGSCPYRASAGLPARSTLDMPWPTGRRPDSRDRGPACRSPGGAVEGWLEWSRSDSLVATFDRKLGGRCSGPGGSRRGPAEAV